MPQPLNAILAHLAATTTRAARRQATWNKDPLTNLVYLRCDLLALTEQIDDAITTEILPPALPPTRHQPRPDTAKSA
jgi:hypothetical protein